MMGRSVKRVELCERENRLSLQKCLVAAEPIAKGEYLTARNVVARRTGGHGIPAKYINDVIGKPMHCDLALGDIIDV